MGYNLAAVMTPELSRLRRGLAPRPGQDAVFSPVAALGAVLLAAALAAPAAAGPLENYTEPALAAAQGAGKVVLIHFTALGCNVCETQTQALDRLLAERPFDSITGFQADFDVSGELVRALRVTGRSTLILLRGKTELAREAGLASDADLKAFLRKAFPEKRRGRPKARPSNRVPPRP